MLGLDINQAILDQAKSIGQLQDKLAATHDDSAAKNIAKALLASTKTWGILVKMRDAQIQSVSRSMPSAKLPTGYDDDD